MTMTTTTKLDYSENEERLLKILRQSRKPIDTNQLVEAIYGNAPPFHANAQVISTMRTLIRKVIYNREAFTINKSERKGPHPMTFHITKDNK